MDTLTRWRLILGPDAEEETTALSETALSGMDETLDLLYNENRRGELGGSMPRMHRWLGDLRQYFPSSVIQLVQRDALTHLGLTDLLLEPELLAALEPDIHLAGVLLEAYESLDEARREAARQVIQQVADRLIARIKLPLHQAIRGRLQRDQRLINPPWSQIDWHRTIRRNLKHYQPDLRTLIPETRIGFHRKHRRHKELIILVDQSGSMHDSLIYAGLYAAVLGQIPTIRLSIFAFDTRVLDLTNLLHDPVDLLLGFQLGGGTDIGNALAAARKEIQSPRDATVVLISDLFDGGLSGVMFGHIQAMLDSGTNVVALLALGQEGAVEYDQTAANRLLQMGIPAFACGMDQFPELMSRALAGDDVLTWWKQVRSKVSDSHS
ncbi:MAG: VWA domain-containing protein [Saprospiraceae bacterium]|nr:VWA domain-containing protein [Saprospiraceae bacterium]